MNILKATEVHTCLGGEIQHVYLRELSNTLFKGDVSVNINNGTTAKSVSFSLSGDVKFTLSMDESCCWSPSHFLFASSKRVLYFSTWDCCVVIVCCCLTQSSSKCFTLDFKSWISSSYNQWHCQLCKKYTRTDIKTHSRRQKSLRWSLMRYLHEFLRKIKLIPYSLSEMEIRYFILNSLLSGKSKIVNSNFNSFGTFLSFVVTHHFRIKFGI